MTNHADTFSSLTKVFLVLLRIAIGWHFLYEGLHKLETYKDPSHAFSDEPFLRRATGPFRDFYRDQLEDPDGLDRLDPSNVFAEWDRYLEGFRQHYGLTKDQADRAAQLFETLKADLENFFNDPQTKSKTDQYKQKLQEYADGHNQWNREFQQQWLSKKQTEVETLRKSLVGEVDSHTAQMKAQLNLILDDAQHLKKPYRPTPTTTDQRSYLIAWGLTVVGGCLLLGLFSRLAALGAAGFLAMVYFAMPPWPGLPPNPAAEGFYMFVSKELVELLAALVLATTPSGRWAGIDALLHALVARPLNRPPNDVRA